MKRRLLVATVVSALAFCGQALAKAPTPTELAGVERLLGFDVLLDASMDRFFSTDENFSKLAPAARACWKTEIVEVVVRPKLDQAFAGMFESSENISAWMAFGTTSGGAKFTNHMREGMLAVANGTRPRSMNELRPLLDNAEVGQIKAFMDSDAGRVLDKPFPRMKDLMSEADIEAASQRVASKCGTPPGMSKPKG